MNELPAQVRDRGRLSKAIWFWIAVLAIATLGLWMLRQTLEEAHMALAYLLVVLGAGATIGRREGLLLAVLSFFCFNFFLLSPHYTLAVQDPLDWLILVAFLVTSALATQLLYRAQRAAATAERRAIEIDRLSAERIRLAAEAERANALQEANRFKDVVIASVSHDLRTPLTTIKALAHDLLETGDERAAIIEEEADRLNRFVSDLLDLSRLNSGALSMQPELIAAEDLLGAALQRVSGMPGGPEIVASIEPVDPILVGSFDFAHSLRALVNLIENALKYSPAGVPIEVRVTPEDDFVAFHVLDRGRGIPPDEVPGIWEPFRRRAGDEPDRDGTGLGLSIALRLAVAQDGQVRYRERPGGGSIFTLLLPVGDVSEIKIGAIYPALDAS
jgi:two-component system sensor histidine kinase KdpD